MEPITKKEKKTNLGLLKKLICRVVDYNLKHDVHIFIDVSPHVEAVIFRVYNTSNRRCTRDSDIQQVWVYYDGYLPTVLRGIETVESWLTEK